VGHKLVAVHVVFDMQPDIIRRGRLVERGHLMDSPSSTSHPSVVSRESVLIGFLLAVPNYLEILSDARTGQEVFVACGQTFVGRCISRKAEIVGALQGLSSSEADMRSCLAEKLCDRLSYESCQANCNM
jgi:hypothetical protein